MLLLEAVAETRHDSESLWLPVRMRLPVPVGVGVGLEVQLSAFVPVGVPDPGLTLGVHVNVADVADGDAAENDPVRTAECVAVALAVPEMDSDG